MNSSIKHLSNIAAKNRRNILGLMSGTSLDGLDLALCEITDSGYQTIIKLRAFKTKNYPNDVVQRLKKVVSVEEVSLRELCIVNTWLGDYHAGLILETLSEWSLKTHEVDCIASHGQSIYHAPMSHISKDETMNATLQMGDGDHIAHKTGILTLSDFRQKHTAAGGEGAPLVAPVDDLLFRDTGENRVLLNIGGIANFTYLPAVFDEPFVTSDTGPGNTLINKAVQNRYNKPYDKDGEIARNGTVNRDLFGALLEHSYLNAPFPKTTGPEMFNMAWVKEQQEISNSKAISGEDLIATLTHFSAQTIADAITKVSGNASPKIYISGGGMHNRFMIELLEQRLKTKIVSFEEIGFNPDAKEAACFAVLANEALAGEGFLLNGQKINFGKISLPV